MSVLKKISGAALVSWVLLMPAVAAAQFPTTAPAPAPIKPAQFPPFQEAVLPNGMRLLVVQSLKQPVVAVSLSFPAGSIYDAEGKSGLADMVAALLTKGAGKRSADEVSSAIEGVGGSFSAAASSDFLTVSAGVLSNDAKLAFELVADAVMRPAFPEKEVALVRTQTLSSLQLNQGLPATIASQAFMKGLFGTGAYGRTANPRSVDAITRTDLVLFHRDRIKPSGALLVVAGNLSLADAKALATAAFAGWSGAPVPAATPKMPAAAPAMRIVLVHRPGSVQSNIIAGNVTWLPTDPRAYAARIANKILGGGANARLFLILREQKSWTYGAYSNLVPLKNAGYFQANSEVRTEVTDSALVELLAQLKRIGNEPVPAKEFDDAKNALTGTFPLSIETAGQVAGQVATAKLLGLPADYVQTYRQKLSAVTPEAMQAAARATIRPEHGLVVVVGDGTKLYAKLKAIGPVSIVAPDGTPLTPEDLTVKAALLDLDMSKIVASTDSFAIFFQGNALGFQSSTLAKSAAGWTYTERTGLATFLNQTTVVTATDALVPLKTTQSGKQGPVETKIDVTYTNGHAKGSATTPTPQGAAQTIAIDADIPAGTIDDNMITPILPGLKWASGAQFKLSVFSSGKGTVSQADVKVTGEETITVPAGTFEAYKVSVTGLDTALNLWIEKGGAHRLLKEEYVGQPIEVRRIK